MTTTPDYAELIGLLNALAVDHECDEEHDAKETCDKSAEAIRTLLERNEALERERDELLEELGRVIMACPMSPEMRTRPADVGVKALRADRDRLEARVKELERERDEARRQSDRFCDKYLAALSRAEAAEAERDRLTERVAELEKVREVAVDALKWLSNAARYDPPRPIRPGDRPR